MVGDRTSASPNSTQAHDTEDGTGSSYAGRTLSGSGALVPTMASGAYKDINGAQYVKLLASELPRGGRWNLCYCARYDRSPVERSWKRPGPLHQIALSALGIKRVSRFVACAFWTVEDVFGYTIVQRYCKRCHKNR